MTQYGIRNWNWQLQLSFITVWNAASFMIFSFQKSRSINWPPDLQKLWWSKVEEDLKAPPPPLLTLHNKPHPTPKTKTKVPPVPSFLLASSHSISLFIPRKNRRSLNLTGKHSSQMHIWGIYPTAFHPPKVFLPYDMETTIWIWKILKMSDLDASMTIHVIEMQNAMRTVSDYDAWILLGGSHIHINIGAWHISHRILVEYFTYIYNNI